MMISLFRLRRFWATPAVIFLLVFAPNLFAQSGPAFS
jgi:hypothetical protein